MLENIRKPKILKLLPQHADHLLPDPSLPIKRFKRLPLLRTGVSADRTDVDHPVAKLHKGAPHHRHSILVVGQIGNVAEYELDEFLVARLAQPGDEGGGGQRLAHAVGDQTVLGKAVIEERGDGGGGRVADLFLLFDEVGAADEANGCLLAEGGEELEHGGFYGLFVFFFFFVGEKIFKIDRGWKILIFLIFVLV